MGGFSIGMPEMMIVGVVGVVGVIPWVAGIWALVTLYRVKQSVDAIERKLNGRV